MITGPTVNINNIRNRTPRNATNGASNVRNVVTKRRPRTATVSRIEIRRFFPDSKGGGDAVAQDFVEDIRWATGASICTISSGESTRTGVRAEGSAPCSDLTSKCTEARHRRGRPMPLGTVDHVQGRPVPPSGVEMVDMWKWRFP